MTEAIAAIAADYTAAWNSGSAEAVGSIHAEAGGIVINRGRPRVGRAGVHSMTQGFFADVLDFSLVRDGLRHAGDHVVYFWTFTGHHAVTRNRLRITGWKEWDMDAGVDICMEMIPAKTQDRRAVLLELTNPFAHVEAAFWKRVDCSPEARICGVKPSTTPSEKTQIRIPLGALSSVARSRFSKRVHAPEIGGHLC